MYDYILYCELRFVVEGFINFYSCFGIFLFYKLIRIKKGVDLDLKVMLLKSYNLLIEWVWLKYVL